MANDAIITSTGKDFYSGAGLLIPIAVIAGGVYFWAQGETSGKKLKGAPADSDVATAVYLGLAVVGGIALWKSWSSKPAPVVQGLPPYEGPP